MDVWDLGARKEIVGHLRRWARPKDMPKDPAGLNEPYLLVGATNILNGVSVAIRGDGEVMIRPKQKVRLKSEPFDKEDVIASLAIPLL